MTREELFQKFDRRASLIKPDSKILLLTHNDLDGEGPALMLKSNFNNIEVKHCSNGTMDNDILYAATNRINEFDYIFITDISCSKDTADLIAADPKIARKIFLLDHHSTAMYLNNYSFAIECANNPENSFTNKFYEGKDTLGLSCGTSLMLDFLYNYNLIEPKENLEHLAFNIETYDTWDWVNVFDKMEFPRNLNKLYELYGLEYFENRALDELKTNKATFGFNDTDKLLLDIDNKKCEEYIKRKSKGIQNLELNIDSTGYKVCVAIGEDYLADLFDYMQENNEADFYAIYTGYNMSFRSRPTEEKPEPVNVAEIAAYLGGGGHPQASGAHFRTEEIVNILEHLLTKDPIPEINKTQIKPIIVNMNEVDAASADQEAANQTASDKSLADLMAKFNRR